NLNLSLFGLCSTNHGIPLEFSSAFSMVHRLHTKCRLTTKGSLAIVAVRNSVRPNHLFDHNLDHDYYFELPVRGVGCPIITPVIYDAPWRCTGSPTCEPNFLICS